MSSSAPNTFARHEVEDYEKRRYRGIDQKLVDVREKRILKKILKRLMHDGEPVWRRQADLVLDAPCGYGRFSGLLLEAGAALISSDLSFHMVGRALEKNKGSRCVGGAVADLKSGLPFKGASFDYVFSMRFFHHLHDEEDRLRVLRELARVAKKGVVLSYYRLNRFHAFQRKINSLIKRRRRRIKMIPRHVFQREIDEAGFILQKTFPLFRGVHAQSIVWLKKG